MKNVVSVAALLSVCVLCLPASDVLGAQAQAPAVGLWPKPVAQTRPAVPGAKEGAVVLSLAIPGAGEWLNRDFAGSFPLAECLFGCICPLVRMSSALDAAAGDRSGKIRIEFWSKPIPEQ